MMGKTDGVRAGCAASFSKGGTPFLCAAVTLAQDKQGGAILVKFCEMAFSVLNCRPQETTQALAMQGLVKYTPADSNGQPSVP